MKLELDPSSKKKSKQKRKTSKNKMADEDGGKEREGDSSLGSEDFQAKKDKKEKKAKDKKEKDKKGKKEKEKLTSLFEEKKEKKAKKLKESEDDVTSPSVEVVKKRKKKKDGDVPDEPRGKKRKVEESSSEEKTLDDPSVPFNDESSPKKKKLKGILKNRSEINETIDDAADSNDAASHDAATPKSKREKMREKRNHRRLAAKSSQPLKNAAGEAIRVVEAAKYLRRWKRDKGGVADDDGEPWKFNKMRQTWLLANMFDVDAVDDDVFSILLDYLRPLTGKAKDRTVVEAEKKVDEEGVAPLVAERARVVVQALC